MTGPESVSYTHLDVYKRQRYGKARGVRLVCQGWGSPGLWQCSGNYSRQYVLLSYAGEGGEMCIRDRGNIWMFPYRVGQYGGGAFLVPYILFIVLFGLVGLSAEFAIGDVYKRQVQDCCVQNRFKWSLTINFNRNRTIT